MAEQAGHDGGAGRHASPASGRKATALSSRRGGYDATTGPVWAAVELLVAALPEGLREGARRLTGQAGTAPPACQVLHDRFQSP